MLCVCVCSCSADHDNHYQFDWADAVDYLFCNFNAAPNVDYRVRRLKKRVGPTGAGQITGLWTDRFVQTTPFVGVGFATNQVYHVKIEVSSVLLSSALAAVSWSLVMTLIAGCVCVLL